jgi:hypothetical protein
LLGLVCYRGIFGLRVIMGCIGGFLLLVRGFMGFVGYLLMVFVEG